MTAAWWFAFGDERSGPAGPAGAAPPVSTAQSATEAGRAARPTLPPTGSRGDDALRVAAERLRLPFRNVSGKSLPDPPADAARMGLAKLCRTLADASGRAAVIDEDAVAAHGGQVCVTTRYVLAGADDRTVAAARLQDAEDADVREAGLETFAELPGVLRAPLLGGVIALDPDVDVRAAAVEVLGRERDRRAVDPLIRALGDADEFVRQSARASLLAQGDGLIRSALLDAAAHGPKRVREMARTMLDENLAIAGDGSDPGAGPADGIAADTAQTVVVHDIEGRRSTVVVSPGGACRLVVSARGRVVEQREGRLDDPERLVEGLISAGVGRTAVPYRAAQSAIVREADDFVVHVSGPDGTVEATGDLRAAPPSIREAVRNVVDAAAALPSSARAPTYLSARRMTREERDAAQAAGLRVRRVDAAAIGGSAVALDIPGAVAPADRDGLERALGAVDDVFPLLWKDEWLEVTLLGER